MFTGLIAHCGEIVASKSTAKGKQFSIRTEFSNLIVGESIAVNGICLTVIAPEKNLFSCELSTETLAVTAAKYYQVGQQVNLERALLATDRLGGHIVSGHIDGVATVTLIEQELDFCRFKFEPSEAVGLKYLVPKGSIAIDGVSLTANQVGNSFFEVMLIPHTLVTTNLSRLVLNQTVNIEYDMLAKIVAKQVEKVYIND